MLRLSETPGIFSLARLILVWLFLAAGSLSASAQGNFNVGGTVRNSSGDAVIGATVVEEGSPRGAITDAEGRYNLSVSSSEAVLVISYVGMATQTVTVGERRIIDVTLSEDVTMLDDVVVTALGIKREAKALGYAVSQVNAEELTAGREQNVMAAVIGKVAGVDITTTAAGPSGSTRVLIRGNSQLSGSNQPLYVLDGQELDNTAMGSDVGKNGGYDYGDVLSSINQADIESISVLKGPAASALYGSRGSNGVVLITTKSARDSKRLGIEVSSDVSIVSLLTKFDDYQRVYGMGRSGQAPINESARQVSQTSWGGKLDPSFETFIYNGEKRDYGNKNDNILSFFDTGVTLSNSVALTSANEKSSMRLSLSDVRNWDIVPNSTLNRTVVTFRGQTKLGKRITAEAQATYTHEEAENRPALGDSSNNIGLSLIGIAPNFHQSWLAENYKDDNGRYYNWNGSNYQFNPYWIINEARNTSARNRLMAQSRISWEIIDGLTASFRGSLDRYDFRATRFTPVSTPLNEGGAISETVTLVNQVNLDAMLNYTKQLGEFDLSGFVGWNLRKHKLDGFNPSGANQELPGVYDLNAFSTRSDTHSFNQKEVRSVYGQVSAGYKGIYYLDATFRNDWSSTLRKGNNSYFYPSVSGSIVFSDMFAHGDWLSFGKVRVSWASVGGDTNPYAINMRYGLKNYTINGQALGQVATGSIANPDIRPTRTNSVETGLDVRFFNNRLGIDATYYRQDTRDQIINLPISVSSGFSNSLINAGKIRNEGIELVLSAKPFDGRNFKWSTNISYSKNINSVIELHPDVPNYELAAARWANAYIYALPGEPFGAIMGTKIVRAPNGQMLLNENGMPQFEEKVSVLGYGNYTDIIGWTHTFTYKNLSLTAVLDAKLGADVYSMSAMTAHTNGTATATLEGREGWAMSEQERLSKNITTDDWRAKGGYLADGVVLGPVIDGVQWYYDNKELENYVNPQDYWTSFREGSAEPFIIDASYVKLREMSLTYNLPKRWLEKIRMESVSISLYGRNLLLLYAKTKNIDPEATYSNANGKGFEYGSLPSRRTFGFGVNIKF